MSLSTECAAALLSLRCASLGYKRETFRASSVVKKLNAYHDLEDLNMQEWEDLCQHHPPYSRDLDALLEDITGA